MGDFGAAEFGLTRYNNDCVVYESHVHEGHTYEFTLKRTLNNDRTMWKCTDPDGPNNAHYCVPRTTSKVLAGQIRQFAVKDIKTSGKRPHEAYTEALAASARQLNVDPPFREAVNQDMPVFRKQNELPFIIIASDKDLGVLHQSRHWEADVTFKYCLNDVGFAQLYVLFGFIGGEAVAAVHALMPKRRQETYQQLFGAMRNGLIQRFGSVGALETGHFDFEAGAIAAFRSVFPGSSAKGCAFHFAQAINKKIGELGLKPVYDRSPAKGYDAPQYSVVHTWVRRVIGLCLIPPEYVLHYWNSVLKFPPQIGVNEIDDGLQWFPNYFTAQWLRSQDQIRFFNHNGNDGPRTNNHAEGYNNSLSAKFHQKHPKLSMFLVEFQEHHHEIQHNVDMLYAGQSIKPKVRLYIDSNETINQAKGTFRQHVWMYASWPNFENRVHNEITNFVDHVQEFFG